MSLQIRMGRDVRCCVPGVARPRGRGWLSRNVSLGLKKRTFKLSVTAEMKQEGKKDERHHGTLSHNVFFLIRR